jgi:hypothetical protein
MIDFSNLEIVEGGGGFTTLIFDLNEETIKELEDALQVQYTSPLFSERFQVFVEDAIKSYLKSKE